MRPRIITHSSRNNRKIIPKSYETFIGYDADGQPCNTATREEFGIAREKFAEFFAQNKMLPEQQLGTKLYCYDYVPITYYLDNGTPFRLNHSFIKMKTGVFAINPSTHALIDKTTPEGQAIPAAHWSYASAALARKDINEKLYSHCKVDNNLGIKHCFIMLLGAAEVDGVLQFIPTLFAMAGNKWANETGSFSRHKVLINEKDELFDLKISRKYSTLSGKGVLPSTEEEIAKTAGLLVSSAKKTIYPHQNLFLTQLYKTDFFVYACNAYDQLKKFPVNSDAKIQAVLKYKQQFTHLLLQVIIELESLHSKGILHRDIKLENVLVNYSATQLHARIADFGLATVLTEGAAIAYGRPFGTPVYMAPELFIGVEQGAVAYTTKSDYFALGHMLALLDEKILRRMHPENPENAIFNKLALRLKAGDPNHRPHLGYIQLALLCDLSSLCNTPLDVLLGRYHFPFQDAGMATLLNTFFMEALNTEQEEFSDRHWLDVFIKLESDLTSSDVDKQHSATAELDFYQNSAASPDTMRAIFTIRSKKQYLGFSTQWFIDFLKRCEQLDERPEKIVALAWLYDDKKNALQLNSYDIFIPVETLWSNEPFWTALEALISEHLSGSQQSKVETEKNIIALLEEVLGKAPGRLYFAETHDFSSGC